MAELGTTKSWISDCAPTKISHNKNPAQTGVSTTPIKRTPTAKYRRTADVSPRKAARANNEMDEFRTPSHLQKQEALQKRAVISPAASQPTTPPYTNDGFTTGRLSQSSKASKMDNFCSSVMNRTIFDNHCFKFISADSVSGGRNEPLARRQ
jgi:hypothetical protein